MTTMTIIVKLARLISAVQPEVEKSLKLDCFTFTFFCTLFLPSNSELEKEILHLLMNFERKCIFMFDYCIALEVMAGTSII